MVAGDVLTPLVIDALWRATWASGGRADNRIREAASSNYPRLEPRRREASERNRSRWRPVRNIHRSALTLCGARASDGTSRRAPRAAQKRRVDGCAAGPILCPDMFMLP